jgi:hypothetical protein
MSVAFTNGHRAKGLYMSAKTNVAADFSILSVIEEERSFEYEVSELEARLLRDLVLTLSDSDLNKPTSYIKVGQQWAPAIAPLLTSKINNLRQIKSDALFLRGLPKFTDPNPKINESNTRKLSLLLASMLGEPFQYKQQNNGEIVAHIAPEIGRENTNSSSGRQQFGWHTDDSFLDEPFRADYITLTGYINPSHVRTNLSSIDEIIQYLPEDDIHELMKPKFSLRLPSSFRLQDNSTVENIPLIWFDGRRRLNIALSAYNVETTRPDDIHGQNAIEKLLIATNVSATSVDLQAGTMLIFRNNKYLHSRNTIPGERLVFRTYVKQSLDDLRASEGHDTFVFDLQKIVAATLGSK